MKCGEIGAMTSKDYLLDKQVYSIQTLISYVGSMGLQPFGCVTGRRVFNKLFPYLLFCNISPRVSVTLQLLLTLWDTSFKIVFFFKLCGAQIHQNHEMMHSVVFSYPGCGTLL